MCAQHGAYQAVISSIRGREIESPCPVCEDEQHRKDLDEYQRRLQEKARRARIEKLFGRAGIPPRFRNRTFATYQADIPAQGKALKLVRGYAEGFDQALSTGAGLILCGSPGTGKTHLACALANLLLPQEHTVVFAGVAAAVRRVKETYRRDSQQSEQQAIEAFIEPDLLILDEVGVQFGSETEKFILFEILNGRYEQMRPSVLISNLQRAELVRYVGERVMDRLQEGGGALVAFDWESYRTKARKVEAFPVARAQADRGY